MSSLNQSPMPCRDYRNDTLPWAQSEQDVADAVTHVNLAPPGGRDPLAGNVLLCIVSTRADTILLLNMAPPRLLLSMLHPPTLQSTFPAAMPCLQPWLTDFLLCFIQWLQFCVCGFCKCLRPLLWV